MQRCRSSAAHVRVAATAGLSVRVGRRFFIHRGELQVISDDNQVVLSMKEGGFFGEIALLYNTKRTVCMMCWEPCRPRWVWSPLTTKKRRRRRRTEKETKRKRKKKKALWGLEDTFDGRVNKAQDRSWLSHQLGVLRRPRCPGTPMSVIVWEIGLLPLASQATIVAKTYCDLFILAKEDLTKVLRRGGERRGWVPGLHHGTLCNQGERCRHAIPSRR